MSVTSSLGSDSAAARMHPAAVAEIRLRPRRTLNRLALALAGLALAALGQVFFGQQSLWDGLLFYGAGAILFSRALAERVSFPPVGSGPSVTAGTAAGQPNGFPFIFTESTFHRGWRRNIGIWLLVVAVGICFFSLNFFATEETQPLAWWFYLAGLVCLVSGGLLLTNRKSAWPQQSQAGTLSGRYLALGLTLILGLALFMRLYHFYSQPFGIWYDEAEAGLQARRILAQPDYRPVFYAPINISGHLLVIYALALNWLGNNIYSLRAISVIFGVAGVLAAYLFGRELHGPRFGLILAFLLAAARWSVNFSRIAMTGIDTVFFEFMSLFFLVRWLRRGQSRDAMWAGLTVGFGLMFYTAFRLYLLALLIFVVIAGLYWRPRLWAGWRNGGWRTSLEGLGLMLLFVVLVTLPLAKFALDNSDAFWYRTNQISIFTRRDQPDLDRALWDSASKHLLMFNFKGDSNGRHNLPGEPMLDPAMGLLAVLGLGLALARPRYPSNIFFLILLPLALAGGIFSVDFEAPQSLRSIAVIPVVIYLAGLALTALGREAKDALKPLPRLYLVGPAVVLAGFIILANASTYFSRQANDFASWNAFSTAETITGHKMAELGPNYTYFLSPFLTNHPTIRFLAPDATDQRPLMLPDALPIREAPDRPVAIFLHPDDVWVFNQAQQIYPDASFEEAKSVTEDHTPVVYFVGLQPADLASIQGLELRYERLEPDQSLADAGLDGSLPVIQAGRAWQVSAAWPADSPSELNSSPQTRSQAMAEWSGVLYAPLYGPYSFRLITPGPGLLEIDGNIILKGQGEQLTGLPLAEGNHSIRVRAMVVPGQISLSWQPPGRGETLVPQWVLYTPPITNHGLLGTFYANDHWEGQPAFQRIDPILDTYFHLVPLQRPYTVEWTGSLDVLQSGIYRLGLRAVQEAQLIVDGQLVVVTAVPNEYIDAPITLKAGRHDILVRFKDSADRSRIHLYWTLPSGQLEVIPSQNLWPPLGRYPPRTAAPADKTTVPLKLEWQRTLGSPGSQPGQFLEPRDIAVSNDGNLIVADTANRRVQILDPQGGPLLVITGKPFPFAEPLAVGVNSRNEILVLDSTLQWVYRYRADGELIDRFGGPTAYLFHPRGLTVLADDTIALADTGSARLALFNAAGVQAGSIGGLGNGPGQFNEPTDVLRDAYGTYFVAEAKNNRLQRVDANGNPLAQWAIPPAYAYDGPHLAFGPDGSIFMTESQSHSLLRYAPDGTLLDQWQSLGPVILAAPVGIYFDAATNSLYITDVVLHQIYVFAVQAAGR